MQQNGYLFVHSGFEENGEMITMQKTYQFRILIWAIFTCCILLIPFIAMQITHEVNWDPFDFLLMGVMIFSTGIIFEIVRKKSENMTYRWAFGVALLASFLLIWFNGAVGIIGNEGNSANLLYFVVFLLGIAGTFMSRFKSRRMAITLFVVAIYQFLVPVIALIEWPHEAISWGDTGIFGVFILNFFFVFLFTVAAFLFWKGAK